MGEQIHKIQRILLEMVNSENETYPEDEKELSGLVNGAIRESIGQICDEEGVNDTTINIPYIEIDLGTLQRPFQKEAIVSLFKEKLRAQFDVALAQSKEEKNKGFRTELDILVYFLRNGILPWWATELPAAASFKDQVFLSGLKNYLLTEGNDNRLERLVKQFSYQDIKLVFDVLVSPEASNVFNSIDRLIYNLSSSSDILKQKSAKLLLQKMLQELVLKKGNIGSFSEFIVEFVSKDLVLSGVGALDIADYLGDRTIADELMQSAAFANKENTVVNSAVGKNKRRPEEQEDILQHYFSFGSLPPGFVIEKSELDFLATEFILKQSHRLATLIKENGEGQHILFRLLVNLPEHHFKAILNDVLVKINSTTDPGKELFSKTFPHEKLLSELRTFASAVVLNGIMDKSMPSGAHLYQQSQAWLNDSEKKVLSAILAKADAEFKPEPGSPPMRTRDPDAGYFSDLLYFMLQYKTLPWWGNFYVETYGKADQHFDFENELATILGKFESHYPKEFIEFTRQLLKSQTKPSVFLSKLSREVSKKILDRALPVYKNSFDDTVNAILDVVSQHKNAGINSKIVSQQLLFFISDIKREERFNFKDAVNEIITVVAVKLNMALWEVYSILLKNYKSLPLKNELTKEEAVSLFAYHETLEEKYSELVPLSYDNNDVVLKRISEISLISTKHEKLILNYLSGHDVALKIFPSSWALEEFILERLKNSPGFSAIINGYLTSGDFGSVYRIVQLEALSAGSWIRALLQEPEHVVLQEELYDLLKDLSFENKGKLRNLIRAAFILEKIDVGEALSSAKLKKIVGVISEGTGISAGKLDQEIKGLSKDENKAHVIRESLGDIGLKEAKQEAELKPFLSYLSGHDVALNIFPSSSALEEFILERLRNSPGFSAIINDYLTSGDFGSVYRIVQLEALSAGSWIRALLQVPEHVVLQEELYDLLKDLSFENKGKLRNLIRTAFILENFNAGETHSSAKLKKIVGVISEETGIPTEKLEQEIIKGLSKDGSKAHGIRESLGDIGLKEPKLEAELKPFLARLNEIEFKKELSVLTGTFDTLTDESRLQELFYKLEKVKDKVELIVWINENTDFQGKTKLISFLHKIDVISSMETLLQLIRTSLRTSLQTLVVRPSYIASFNTFLATIADFEEKPELLRMARNIPVPGKNSILNMLESVREFPGKNEVVDFVTKNFPASTTGLTDKELGRISAEQTEDINDTDVDRAQEDLSPEVVADLLLYFFFYHELPWWSPVKDNLTFEKLAQDLALSTPLLLKKKLGELAESHPQLFPDLAVRLTGEEGVPPVTSPSGENIGELLVTELSYLSSVLSGEKNGESLLPYIREVTFKLRDLQPDPAEMQLNYRKIFTLVVAVLDPSALGLIRNLKDFLYANEEWAFYIDKFVFEKEAKINQMEQVLNLLNSVEEKYNKDGKEKGLSVATNLFLLSDWNNDKTREELFVSWLAMLSTFVDIPVETIRQELITNASLVKEENKNGLLEMLNAAASVKIAEPLFLPAYATYLTAISLILDKADSLSSQQRSVSLELLAGLLKLEGLKGKQPLAFGLFFKYLEENGVSATEVSGIIDSLKNLRRDPELNQILDTIRDMANNIYPKENYTPEIEKQKEESFTDLKNTGLSAQYAVDKIISTLQARKPLFEIVQEQTIPGALKVKEEEPLRKSSKQTLDLDLEGRIYVPNAGLIILWPFLSRLFSNLKYTEKGLFIDDEKQLRAIHLTQYLVGFTEDHPEYTLVLNKLICGMPLLEPIERIIYLSAEEKMEARNLLSAVLVQWKEMSNTSLENFQRTFIQRAGVIYQKDGNWYIKVDHTPFDILLLKLPWGLSIVKYPWNNYLIFVEWKAMN